MKHIKYFSDHNRIDLEISNLDFFYGFYLFIFRDGEGKRKRGRETSMCGCQMVDQPGTTIWILNNIFINESQVTEEITRKSRIYFEL